MGPITIKSTTKVGIKWRAAGLKGVDTDDEVSMVLHGRAVEEGLRMVKESKDKVTGKNKQE